LIIHSKEIQIKTVILSLKEKMDIFHQSQNKNIQNILVKKWGLIFYHIQMSHKRVIEVKKIVQTTNKQSLT
jgi:hypothetical protein